MSKKIIRLGLIGKDVSKSNSESIHTFLLGKFGYGCSYQRVSVAEDGFFEKASALMRDCDGFSVTIPYKLEILKLLDSMSVEAQEFGSVNTVVTREKKGYNTDGIGFMQMLCSADISVKGKRVLILGAGGAGRSAAVALKKAGASVYLYQRRKDVLEKVCQELGVFVCEDAEAFEGDILVNATGVGMLDTVGVSPVSERAFFNKQAAIDLIYKPTESEFLRLAKKQGLTVLNGGAMLFYQAYYADCLFLERKADEKEAKALYLQYLNEQK